MFLTEFANLLVRVESQEAKALAIAPREIEVLKAMMEKVKLKKENYVALMRGMKVFIE